MGDVKKDIAAMETALKKLDEQKSNTDMYEYQPKNKTNSDK